MADNQEASIGWGGEAWLSTDDTVGNLAELVQVTGFGLPEVEVDQVESTHLKSEDGYKEYIDGLKDGGVVEIRLNFRPGSDTDEKIDDWEDGRGKRKVRLAVPLQGEVVKTYTFSATFAGYSPGEVTPDGLMESTLRVRLAGAITKAAA